MADTIKSAIELKISMDFIDGDTRTISVTNPRANLTSADVTTVSELFRTKNIFVGDKGGADFKEISSAKKVQTTKNILDLDS